MQDMHGNVQYLYESSVGHVDNKLTTNVAPEHLNNRHN